jgi:hypothetical protein
MLPPPCAPPVDPLEPLLLVLGLREQKNSLRETAVSGVSPARETGVSTRKKCPPKNIFFANLYYMKLVSKNTRRLLLT